MNLIFTALLLSLPLRSSQFSPAAPGGALPWPTATVAASGGGGARRPAPLAAKRKRRRRKAAAPSPAADPGELPDFDDGEGEGEEVMVAEPMPAAVAPPIKRGTGLSEALAEEVGGNVDGLDEEVIMGAMRGKGDGGWEPPRSIQDTLSDRRLEKFMDFDKMIEQDGGGGDAMDLPDFDEVIARRKRRDSMDGGAGGGLVDTSGMGKKAAKNAQRRAAAAQREAAAEADKSPFEDLDFDFVKLLEKGAWVGIGLLVLWEFYINSPFFNRAAPLIPVVYDKFSSPDGM